MIPDSGFKEGKPEPLRTAIAEMEALVKELEARLAQPSADASASASEPAADGASVPAQVAELMDWLRADLAARSFGTRAMAHVPLPSLPNAPEMPQIPWPQDEDKGELGEKSPADAVIEIKDHYGIPELLGQHDDAFLRNAFRAIMHREPDPEGLFHFRSQLEQGHFTRLDVLAELRYSAEGRKVGTRIDGFGRVRVARMLRRIPVLGGTLALLHAFLRLPTMARRLDLLGADLMRSEWDARVRLQALREVMRAWRASDAAAARGVAQALSVLERAIGELRAHAGHLEASERVLRSWAGVFGENLALMHVEVRRQMTLLAAAATREELLRAAREGLASMHSFAQLGKRLEEQLGTMALVEAGAKQAMLAVANAEAAHRSFEAEYRGITDALARDVRERLGSAETDAALDTFYLEFENRFRGTREDIKSRVQVYLVDARAASEATGGAPIVDIGCGRGEWLEVLRDNGLAARGVDANASMAQATRALGLEVVDGDALRYLRTLPPMSLGGVTGFHVIEHLQFPELVAVFAEALRVLKPGGLVVFETPNPENLNVGAHTFWYDPSHVRPLAPAVVEYVAQSQGFVRTELRRLHPYETWEALGAGPDEEVRARLNSALYGPRDYAILAWKP